VAVLQRAAWRKRCVRAPGLESIEGKDVEGKEEGDGGEGRKGEVGEGR
jgi:hypothetical protein